MGLPEKKNFKKRSMRRSGSLNEEFDTTEEDVEMRRKRVIEARETEQTELPQRMIPAGLVNMKMEFVENDRNSGRFSPMLGEQQYVRSGNFKFRVQNIKKKAALQEEDDRIELLQSVEDAKANATGPLELTD